MIPESKDLFVDKLHYVPISLNYINYFSSIWLEFK